MSRAPSAPLDSDTRAVAEIERDSAFSLVTHRFMFGLGFTEVIVILVVALIFLGPEKLPEVAKSLGKVLGELRRTTDDLRRDIMFSVDDEPTPPSKHLAATPLGVPGRAPTDPLPVDSPAPGVVAFAAHDGDEPHNCEHCDTKEGDSKTEPEAGK